MGVSESHGESSDDDTDLNTVEGENRKLYQAACYLRGCVEDIPQRIGPWPRNANDLDDQTIKCICPMYIIQLHRLEFGESDKVNFDGYVETPDDTRHKIIST
jgi:hypothetical protein